MTPRDMGWGWRQPSGEFLSSSWVQCLVSTRASACPDLLCLVFSPQIAACS